MQPNELKVGAVYFGLGYEDDNCTRPIVHTYEFVGIEMTETSANAKMYLFRFVGSEDELQLTEQQVDYEILDVASITEQLRKWSPGTHLL